MKADARLASQAVILGTSDRDDATVLALPISPGTATVELTVVGPAGHRAASGSITVALTTAPNTTGAPQITGSDAATGARWTAGLWGAASVAASALGKDLTDLAYAASPSGATDGVAGSALVTAG